MRFAKPSGACRPCAAGRAAVAQAQPLPDLSLEELMRIDAGRVFGASERLQPVTEAPASVSFITAEDIARYGYRTLADILRGVRGHVRDGRSQLQLSGHARVRQAGRLQQPHPAAGQRTPRQRQRLRTGGDRRGVRHRSGDVRARRNHPRARLVALRRQRVLRGRQRDHADRRVARRRLDRGRGRHARHRADRAPASDAASPTAWTSPCQAPTSEVAASSGSTSRRSTRRPPTTAWPRGSTANESGSSTAISASRI